MGAATPRAHPPGLGRPDLGPIDQVAYVVADLSEALPRYQALFGPFEVGESLLRDCTIRGRRADCRLKLAVNRTGPVEVELIQVVEGETPHSDHLRAHGEGLHHVRFRVDDLDAAIERLEREGFETLMHKRFGPRVAFAYLQRPAGSVGVIELLELA
jgi:catechol 2,3-dioxygenase-like lactoylglutathione lyase family enzyme